MSTRRARAAVPALLSVALLTACGGGDDPKASASPTPAGLTKAEFVTQAEALCTKANAEVDAIADPQTLEELSAGLDKTLQVADSYTTQLETLAAKQADKAEIDKIFLTPLRGQVTALQEFAPELEAAAAKGEAAVDALEEPEVPDADLTAMKAYGFTDCVETAKND